MSSYDPLCDVGKVEGVKPWKFAVLLLVTVRDKFDSCIMGLVQCAQTALFCSRNYVAKMQRKKQRSENK